jgi:hypothetical protein
MYNGGRVVGRIQASGVGGSVNGMVVLTEK